MAVHRSMLAAALGLAVCANAACYESAAPLDPSPQADIDARLPGAWHCIGSDPGDRDMTLTIARTRDRVYALTLQEYGQDADRYEAYASRVGSGTIVNVRDVTRSEKPWAFIRYTLLTPTVLQLQVLDDRAMKGVGASAGEVRQAIAQRMKDARSFTDACTCVRMNEK
jgi:hypothetical protein